MAFAKDSPTRKKLFDYIKEKKLFGVGCEVGVQEGEFSKVILETWPGERLVMVDTWRHIPGYQDIANRSDARQAFNMLVSLTNTAAWSERRTLICEWSSVAASFFPNEYFDWVYLDAAHDEISVTVDLHAWWPKVKKGGIICGDDFADQVTDWAVFGVKSAVEKFGKPHVEFTDPVEMAQWAIEKNEP